MNWQQIRLVWLRELRDQLRDRRTLFVIFVLPLLMYPMLGILLFRLTQFVQQHDGRVEVVGVAQLGQAPELPPLISGNRFDKRWFATEREAQRLTVTQIDRDSLDEARKRLRQDEVDVVIAFPDDFAQQIMAMREQLAQPVEARSEQYRGPPPRPVVYFNSTRDTSQVTHAIVSRVLQLWQDKIVEQTLASGHVPLDVTQPFVVEPQDVSAAEPRRALWSKLLPLVMFVWALTGAFYPAVDLCAGEKERGTLETLLTSPAGRTNIVGGKLLTVMTFSAMSAICNMGTLALTGKVMSGTLQALNLPLDPPPLSAIGWLLVGLIPMTTLFSAASLALAALAKSTKEGQYYLMPLLLISMPLLMLPLLPGIELTLTTSLLPVTGMILVLRAAMEGDVALAATYVAPMALVTLACCVMAIRWAVSQFNQEDVLFRDTESFDLRSWIRHTYRHRGEVGGLGSALLCILAMYLLQFAIQNFLSAEATFASMARTTVIFQVTCFLLPAILFAVVAARRPLRALLISLPERSSPARLVTQTLLAVMLAVALHPAGLALGEVLEQYFPISEDLKEFFRQLETKGDIPLWQVLALLALLPAVIEELAFRGFVLSGLRSRLSVVSAVLITSVAFGFAHTISMQQTISATLLGLVLGIIAVKTNHISPCIGFHLSYNGLHLLRVAYSDKLRDLSDGQPLWSWVFTPGGETGVGYTPMMVIAASVASLALLALIWQLGRSESSGTSRSSSPDADGMPQVS